MNLQKNSVSLIRNIDTLYSKNTNGIDSKYRWKTKNIEEDGKNKPPILEKEEEGKLAIAANSHHREGVEGSMGCPYKKSVSLP